ncbi:putative odorant receptor 63a [Lucilia cuprina]|uniref:Odorant receptor n=1 Tax=Lucilia cuprina TaxID=7375 RepID=A0A0L0C635_LUCCU|nr:putative odorant receptor 63a [Lucilia cuprina]
MTLVISSILGLGGQYYFIWENRSKSMLTYTDAICTSFQTWISISKLFHFAFTQHKFEKLVKMAQNTEILQNFEIFELNIFNKKHITEEIQGILDDSWLDIKRQLNFYIISVFGIVGWYYFSCLAVNIYNTYTYSSPTEFELLYRAFPMWRDKGIQFPYYFITYIISGSETHISGMSAVSFAGLYIVTSLHTLALLKILRRLVAYSTTEDVLPQERVKYILAWAKLHQRIYECVKNIYLLEMYLDQFILFYRYFYEINSLYYIQSAPLFLCSMLVICLLIFQGSVGLVGINIVIPYTTIVERVLCIYADLCPSITVRLAVYPCKPWAHATDLNFQDNLMKYGRNLLLKMVEIGPLFRLAPLQQYPTNRGFRLIITLNVLLYQQRLGSDVDVVIKMVLYFSAAGFEVSMFCFNGQRLTSESERLPVALYNCKWYEECTEFKFIIRMMLMRTNRTLAIQVGGFTTMSLVTLLGIMRSSFSYCLLLREFNSE